MKTKINKTEIKKLIKANLYQVLLVFIAFTAMVLVSVFFVRNIITDRMYDLSKETINRTETAVNGMLERMDLVLTDFARTVDGMISGLDEIADEDIEEIRTYIYSVYDYYAVYNPEVLPELLTLYGYVGGVYLDGLKWGDDKHPDGDMEGFEEYIKIVQQRDWYVGGKAAGGASYFTEPYIDAQTHDLCISISKLLKNVDTDPKSVLSVDIRMDQISQYVMTQEIANNGYGMLVSNHLAFVAHPNELFVSYPDDDTIDGLVNLTMDDERVGGAYDGLAAELRVAMKTNASVSAFRFNDYDGVNSIAFFQPLYSGWYVGIVVPYSSYMSAVTTMTIVISLLGAALAVLLCFLLLRMSYQRLKSEEENKSKSTFLARMSHEMRTPMNAIIGMTEIARSTHDPEKIEYCMDKINAASKHLLGVINDVLDMSKIEADKLEMSYSDFTLSSVLDQVKTVMSFKLEEKRQLLDIDIGNSVPSAIISDQQRLAQVLTNLVSNANKFSPVGSVIKIYIVAEELDDGKYMIYFDVVDKGIGISKEAKERLFTSFEQADGSISRKFGGTGLGLAISKRIVLMLGGNIGVDSEPGAGSRFYFSIKAEEGRAVAEAEADIVSSDAPITDIFKDKHILIAEDMEINIEIIKSLLEETGINIDTAENGLIAVEMFTKNPDKYDLIFMDMQMPEMDGLDATRAIRALELARAKTVPIIAMTANVFKEDIDRCRAAGMNDHTGKPIDIGDVIGKINKYSL